MQQLCKTLLQLGIPGDAARRKCSRHPLSMNKKRTRPVGTADDIGVNLGRADHAAVGSIHGDRSVRIAAEGVNIKRNTIVKLTVPGTKDRFLFCERSPG